MAQSSDELVKQELIDSVGINVNGKTLRIFPESSTDDQMLFSEGGLTFGFESSRYGSCDACWYEEGGKWTDPLTEKVIYDRPILAVEGTDALNRGSSGNAQYQRFHHALGAVKGGLIGVYYLRPGRHIVQPDLYEMACRASETEKGYYIITTDLNDIKTILQLYDNKPKLTSFLNSKIEDMHQIFERKFQKKYEGKWNIFAKKRSTIIKENYIIKYSARNKRNFVDSSQRAGHIATGEMFLSKYFFPEKTMFYLFLKTFQDEILDLDRVKSDDKEWSLLRNESNVHIITLDDLDNVPSEVYQSLYKIKDLPTGRGDPYKIYKQCKDIIHEKLENNEIKIKDSVLKKYGL